MPSTSDFRAQVHCRSTLAKQAAEDQGFDDALMLDYRGFLAEATGANIFLVIDGRLQTPIPEYFLDGITRQTIIMLAKEARIEVVERDVLPADLATAQEVFLTGTAAEITPVGSIGEVAFTPGPVCELLMDRYHLLTRTAASN